MEKEPDSHPMDHPLTCQVIRTKRRRRTLSLVVERDGSIVIRAPLRMPMAVIEDFFNEKKPWVYRKLRQRAVEREDHKPKKFISGEDFLYLGDVLKLVVLSNPGRQGPLFLKDGTFCLDERYGGKARDLFVAWYKKQAGITLRERLQFYGQQMQLFPVREQVTSARHQWGGCSSKNTVSFTWRLMMAPLPIIDYIVVHELAHIKEKNHSPRFWKIVETTLPDYGYRRDWLKRHGYMLDLV